MSENKSSTAIMHYVSHAECLCDDSPVVAERISSSFKGFGEYDATYVSTQWEHRGRTYGLVQRDDHVIDIGARCEHCGTVFTVTDTGEITDMRVASWKEGDDE